MKLNKSFNATLRVSTSAPNEGSFSIMIFKSLIDINTAVKDVDHPQLVVFSANLTYF